MTRELPTSLLMFIAQRSAEGRIYEAVRHAGFTDVTVAQGRLAAGIDPDGTRLSVLAERAQVAKQTATALVDHLERSGYVERVPDPADGRARLVRLTDRGRELYVYVYPGRPGSTATALRTLDRLEVSALKQPV